jgi:hypothetical protein
VSARSIIEPQPIMRPTRSAGRRPHRPSRTPVPRVPVPRRPAGPMPGPAFPHPAFVSPKLHRRIRLAWLPNLVLPGSADHVPRPTRKKEA